MLFLFIVKNSVHKRNSELYLSKGGNLMIQKLLHWLRKLFVTQTKKAAITEEIIFPDAETLRQETLEKVPFITDKQLLSRIRKAQEEHENYAYVSNFRISDESIEKLKERGIHVNIWTVAVGFKLTWHS